MRGRWVPLVHTASRRGLWVKRAFVRRRDGRDGLAILCWSWSGHSAHAVASAHTADLEDRWNLTTRFVPNKWTGLAVFAGAVASNLVG